jgi:lysophospholipase L1-like esterase
MKGILCFGDSITFGRGENPSIGWCGRLKNYFENKETYNGVYNLGVSGHTSTDLLKRFDVEASGRIRNKRSTDKYLILIAIGTNDAKFDGKPKEENERTTKEQFRKNIKKLITKGKSYQSKLAIIGLTPVDESRTSPYEKTWFKSERVKLFNDTLKELCKQNNMPFLDMYNVMIKQNYSRMLKDGVHPNSQGYNLMFKEIKDFIEDNKLI